MNQGKCRLKIVRFRPKFGSFFASTIPQEYLWFRCVRPHHYHEPVYGRMTVDDYLVEPDVLYKEMVKR